MNSETRERGKGVPSTGRKTIDHQIIEKKKGPQFSRIRARREKKKNGGGKERSTHGLIT